jgi:hypothetical protein
MSTRRGGGGEKLNLKFANFSSSCQSRFGVSEYFSDTPGNPENPGKCPDCPGLRGGFKPTKVKLAQT